MATGLFLLGRLQAFQHFRLTPGLLPEHRIRNVHLRVRPHLILRSFLGLEPAADLEAAIRIAPASDLEGTVPVVEEVVSAVDAIGEAVDNMEEHEESDTA